MLNPAAGQQRGGAHIRRLVGEQEPGEPERTERPITLCLQAVRVHCLDDVLECLGPVGHHLVRFPQVRPAWR
jgi:hypothetical protein